MVERGNPRAESLKRLITEWTVVHLASAGYLKEFETSSFSPSSELPLEHIGQRWIPQPGDMLAFSEGMLLVQNGTGEPVAFEERLSGPLVSSFSEGLSLAHADYNPLASFDTHPDKHGNFLTLGDAERDEWLTGLLEAVNLVRSYAPGIYAELLLAKQCLVPLGTNAESHESASYLEFLGLIYLTLHPNSVTMAEALIHEFSHAKLNLVLRFDSVFTNAFGEYLPSPYRPDPRPLHGLVLGLHAFQAVEKFLSEFLCDPKTQDNQVTGLQRRWADLREKNRQALETIMIHGTPTRVGESLLLEWQNLDQALTESLGATGMNSSQP